MKLKNYWHSLLPNLAFILGLFLQHHSLAYQFTEDIQKGIFWRTFPISIKLQISPSDSRFQVTEQALVDAMNEWHKHSDIQIWDLKESNNSSTNNVIRWSNNFNQETGYSANSTMAITVRYSTPPLLQRTEIIINGQYPGLDNLDDLTMILVHELGHTIGLDHSSDYGSVMYKSLALGTTAQVYLSNDDIEGLSSVMNYHSIKQSQPIQLEQKRSGASNPIDSIASCGQNNQDESSFSLAVDDNKNTILVWVLSLITGFFTAMVALITFKFSRKHFT